MTNEELQYEIDSLSDRVGYSFAKALDRLDALEDAVEQLQVKTEGLKLIVGVLADKTLPRV